MKAIKHLLATAICTASLASAAAYAATVSDSVNFSAGSGHSHFYCTVSKALPTTSVKIDTKNVEIKGFCAGEKYVTTNGHASIPVTTVNNAFFDVDNINLSGGSVTATMDTVMGTIKCYEGKGEGRTPYATADKKAC